MSVRGNERSSRGSWVDRILVAGTQEYELNVLAQKHNVPRSVVEEAMSTVGDDRERIEEYLRRRNSSKKQ